MKIWKSFGSEHSMNLVMIGSFKEISSAKNAHDLILRCRDQMESGELYVFSDWNDPPNQRFTDEQRDFLTEAGLYSLSVEELEQFATDVSIEIEDNRLVLWTDEDDVSAYVKILLKFGGKIEVFSAHDYPGSGHGRGE